MDSLSNPDCVGVVAEPQSSFSAGEQSVSWVVERVCAGAVLHRIATAQRGFVWLLVPDERFLRPEIGEAAAADPSLVTMDGPVGRVCWAFRSRTEVFGRGEDA